MLIDLCAIDPVVGIKGDWLSLHILTTNLITIMMRMMMMMMVMMMSMMMAQLTTQRRHPWWKVTPPTVSESVGESGWLQLKR